MNDSDSVSDSERSERNERSMRLSDSECRERSERNVSDSRMRLSDNDLVRLARGAGYGEEYLLKQVDMGGYLVDNHHYRLLMMYGRLVEDIVNMACDLRCRESNDSEVE